MASNFDYPIIEQYLTGKLSREEITAFQQRLKTDPDFAEAVSVESDLLKGIKAAGRKDLKSQLDTIIIQAHTDPHINTTRGVSLTVVLSMAASIIIAIGLGWWFHVYQHPKNSNLVAAEINKQVMPYPTFTTPTKTFAVDHTKGKQLPMASGGNLSIPSGVVVDVKGNPVQSKISYKDLNNLFDRFISGVPSAIDTAHQVRYLQSVAMFQVSAISGSHVHFDPTKPIECTIPGDDSLLSNGIYKLDTIHKRWVACDQDQIIDMKKYAMLRNITDMFHPRLEDKTKARFKIVVKESQFPELAEYKNYIFEIAPQETHYNPDDEYQVWKSIVVHKGASGEPYMVTFKNEEKTVSYQVTPVFAREYYAQAMKIYKEKMNKIAERTFKGPELEKYEMAQEILQSTSGREQHNFYRVFRIKEPGIYSDSRLINITEVKNVEVTFIDEKQHKLSLSQLAIADFETGVMQHVKVGATMYLPLGNTSGKAILAITTNNKLAYLTQHELSQLLQDTNKTVLKLNVTDLSIKNYSNIKKMFGDQGMAILINFISDIQK